MNDSHIYEDCDFIEDHNIIIEKYKRFEIESAGLKVELTRNPSMQAWRAQIGSISVTYTTHPIDFRDWQHPFPTWP